METTLEPKEIEEQLAWCTGTTRYHRVMGPYLSTDGVEMMADLCQANWLVTDIAAFMASPDVAGEPFIVWTLTVNEDESARLEATDGDGKPLFARDYSYTDFPLPKMKLYVADHILLLPSEY